MMACATGSRDICRCADWEAGMASLQTLNNTSRDACSVGNGQYITPRVAGTFYNTEYAVST